MHPWQASVDAARARFGLTIDDNSLLARVDAIAETEVTSDELVLAAACVANDPAALAYFDQTYREPLRALVARIAGDHAPDAIQTMWTRLLVATPDHPVPRLADYGGRGSLLTWLRVVAAREALSIVRRRREVQPDGDAVFGRLVEVMDPELALIRTRSASVVKRAFEAAIAAATVRERNLLRQHLLDGLSIDELARLYHVHRATAARWLASAREDVWDRTQRTLRDSLSLTPSELASLLGEVRDWIDLSLERVLRHS